MCFPYINEYSFTVKTLTNAGVYFQEQSDVFLIVRFISFEQVCLSNLYILGLRESFMTQNFVISSYYLPSISICVPA